MTNTITLIVLAIILSSSSADVQTLILINALRVLSQISGLTNAT